MTFLNVIQFIFAFSILVGPAIVIIMIALEHEKNMKAWEKQNAEADKRLRSNSIKLLISSLRLKRSTKELLKFTNNNLTSSCDSLSVSTQSLKESTESLKKFLNERETIQK